MASGGESWVKADEPVGVTFPTTSGPLRVVASSPFPERSAHPPLDHETGRWRIATSSVRILGHHVELWAFLLAVADFLLLACAVPIASLIWFDGDLQGPRPGLIFLKVEALLFAVVMLSSMVAMGLYNRRIGTRMVSLIARMLVGLTIGALTMGTLMFFFVNVDTSRGVLIIAPIIGFLLLLVTRTLVVKVAGRERFGRRILVYGTGRRAADLQDVQLREDLQGLRIVGFIASEGGNGLVPRELRIDPTMSLLEFVRKAEVDEVVVALDDRRRGLPVQELLDCRMAGVPVTDVLTFIERATGKVELSMLYPSWLIFSENINRRGVCRVFTRVLDLCVASILMILTGPLMVLTALAIWVDSGFRGGIVFRQQRVGQCGKLFTLYKFRSMRDEGGMEKAQWAQRDDPRITRVGRFLRPTRVDELPQLFNVLAGEMSFVGPRPEQPEFVEQLSTRIPYYRERHCVKPGITGWAQICYQYGASEEESLEKLKYDLYYVKNKSLLFDLVILLQTAEVVLWRKGSR